MAEKEKMTNKYNAYLDEEMFVMIKNISGKYGVTPTEVIRSALKSINSTANRKIETAPSHLDITEQCPHCESEYIHHVEHLYECNECGRGWEIVEEASWKRGNATPIINNQK
tara:strand:- start:3191 stop:3526 length:336 start_codon:yes stop_codon:yes gene_type:complete